jgi:BirA family biotin operon repressor/biotin-[acetyl-CoA-carboxylase] ligase
MTGQPSQKGADCRVSVADVTVPGPKLGRVSEPLRVNELPADLYAAVDVVPTTASTNADLVEAANRGAADRTVLIADEQTGGQGRRARSWASPVGTGLYLSVLLRPDGVLPTRLAWLTMLAGVAVVRTARWAGAEAVLKWPNDLLLGPEQRKGAGILAEAGDGAVVLGIGLNILPLPGDVPLGPGGLVPTSLAEVGATELDRTDIANRLLGELATLERAWRETGGDPAAGGVRDEYIGYCVTVGQRVRVELPNGALTGVATGIDADGSLLLRTDDGEDHSVSAGDVVHLRQAA